MKSMKFKNLSKVIKQYNYILLRDSWGNQYGINCKIARWKETKMDINPNSQSKFYSYMPCTLMEYLTFKAPIS